jgi:VWFA-related protein
VETILFVDGLNASFADATLAREGARAFLQKRGADLPGPLTAISLGSLGASLGGGAARDAEALVAALNQGRSGQLITAKSPEAYGIEGAQQLSLYTLEQFADFEAAKPGRKLAIWISPGWALLSDQDAGLSSKEQQTLFRTIVALSDKLRQARIALYDIDPSGLADANSLETTYYDEFEKGVKSARQVQIGDLGLQILAVQSGGRALNSSNDIAGEIGVCLEDASAYYALSFRGAAGDGPNEYHALEIKLGKSGLTAHTRSGYYAQPEPRPAR